jgi:hypothetical protein
VYTLNIRSVKTQQTVCEVVSLCNIQQYVQNNYMFRPCKRAIFRLFLEPVIRHTIGAWGDEISSYNIHVWLKYMIQ